MRILVVQHDEDGPAGVVGERIAARGGERVTVMPHNGAPVPESPAGFDGALFLGGAMSVRQDDNYPHDEGLFRLARAFHDQGKPIFGICLGSQIVARALGRRVYRHRATEFGFCEVRLTEAGCGDPLFSGLGPSIRPMQWHEDTFDLPDQSVLLATNDICAHQAYRVGRTTYAVQFHPEVDRGIVETWARSPAAPAASGLADPMATLQAQMSQYLASAETLGRTLADRWMDLVARHAERHAA
jgi:GMP synthase-like glutamine amidotransferase